MSKLTETEISKSDVSGIFKQAVELRSQPQGRFSKFFGQKPKDNIAVSDLQQAWQKAGFPDDVRDIEHILKDFGFGDKEIHKVMSGAFGTNNDGQYNEPIASPAIQKLADYAKKAGLTQDLIAFMQKEYGFKESYSHQGKVVVEDVRKIFDAIVYEERSALPKLIKDNEIRQLGRNKK